MANAPEAVAPAVVDRGPGEPEAAVVAGVHGDEPSGVRAVRRLLRADVDLQCGVRVVLANPPAFLAGERFLDADLNRVFPGDEDAAERERRLAARLRAVTGDVPVLSLHATQSDPDPIAVADFDSDVADIAADLPVPHVVDETGVVGGAFTDTPGVVSLEAGSQHTDAAAETAVRQVRAFLSLTGALDRSVREVESEFYELRDAVEKPAAGSYEVRAENFERVERGETVAVAGDREMTADEPFVPVLFSADGYEDVFGYRARRLGDTLAGARRTQSEWE